MAIYQRMVMAMDGSFGGTPGRVIYEEDGRWFLEEYGPRYTNKYELTHDGTPEDLDKLRRWARRWPLATGTQDTQGKDEGDGTGTDASGAGTAAAHAE